MADGVESVLDIFSGLLVWGGLRVSAIPQTERYPYGLGKAEPLASLVVSTVLLMAAAGIAVGAVQEIVTPHQGPAAFTLLVLVGVVVTKEAMALKAYCLSGRQSWRSSSRAWTPSWASCNRPGMTLSTRSRKADEVTIAKTCSSESAISAERPLSHRIFTVVGA